jgi:transcriptional regulator with XRE-family HTH domain
VYNKGTKALLITLQKEKIMSIGTTIKKLRRERGFTQEQLAEWLGVSTNAVSQWECDKTAPDISHLPMLANIFEVSADVLLEIDLRKSQKQTELCAFEAKYGELHSAGNAEERIALCRAMQKKYPNDETVRYCLMRALQNADVDRNFDEIISLGEQLLTSANPEYRMGAVRGLCFSYLHTGERSQALRYADMMPPAEDLHVHVLQDRALAEHCRKYFWHLGEKMYLYMKYLVDCREADYTHEQKHAMWQALHEMLCMIYSNGDFGVLQEKMVKICFFMARESAQLGQIGRTLDELEQMLAYIENGKHDTRKKHTSLLVKGLACMPDRRGKHSEETLAHAMLRYIGNNEHVFSSVAHDERFRRICERLRAL